MKITTKEQFRNNIGKKATCTINEAKNIECILASGSGTTLNLVQDIKSGYATGVDKKGYKYGWNVADSVESYNIKLVEEYIRIDGEPMKDFPEWWNGKPMLVSVDDYSEENAFEDECYVVLTDILVTDGEYIYKTKSLKNKYLIIDDLVSGKRKLTRDDMSTGGFSWKYAVPVSVKLKPEVIAEIIITTDGVEKKTKLTEDQLKSLGIK